MSFDAERFCIDFNIPFWSEGKNVGRRWIAVQCPMCIDHSNHGGFNIDGGYYSCWQCGWHPLEQVVKEITDESWPRVYNIIEQYSRPRPFKDRRNIERPKMLQLPEGTGPLQERHRAYLRSRNFDPDHLEKEYDLKGTGHIGRYAFRLIIPIYFEGELISYEGRDITNQQDLRYKACPLDQEVIPRKHILYGIDKVPGSTLVAVEGVTDVWRLGRGAAATFGTGFTQEQIVLVTKRFDRIILLFDPDEKAQEHAEYLAWQINSLGKEAIIYELEGVEDPGSMPQEDADALMRDALK